MPTVSVLSMLLCTSAAYADACSDPLFGINPIVFGSDYKTLDGPTFLFLFAISCGF